MRRPTFAVLTVALSASLALVAGCGGGSSTPKNPDAAFAAGLSGLTDTDALTVTLKLDTTADKLTSFAAESGSKLDPKVAQEIAGAQIVIETKTDDGSKLSAKKSGSHVGFRLLAKDNETSLAEIRVVDGSLFAQADLKTILDIANKSSSLAELQARAKSLPAFVQAFVGGKWVSLDLNAVKSLLGQFGGGASTGSTSSLKLVDDLRTTLTRDVTATKVGSDSIGDHLRLTGHTKQLATDFLQVLNSDVPAAALGTSRVDPSKIQDRSVTVDAWVKDGALKQLSLDIVQFAPAGQAKAGESLPVVLTFDQSGDDIGKPSGAVPVDLTQLGTLLGGLTG